MFSKSTFQRYMFEVTSTQQRLADTYQPLVAGISDASVRKEVAEFLDQLKGEIETAGRIRETLNEET